MTSLPEQVDEDELKEMFSCADKDGNGRINYKEFTIMCKVPKNEMPPPLKEKTILRQVTKFFP